MNALRLSLCLLLALAGTTSAAQTARALIYTDTGHPLSFVPGRKDGLRFSSFSIGYGAYSPSGGRWLISAVGARATPPTSPTIVLSGTPRGITSVAVQGETLPGLGFAFSSSPTSMGINDKGEFAIGTQASNGSAADRVMIGRYQPSTRLWDTAARQGNLIPGLEQTVPGALGERYGSQLSVAEVLADGRVAFTAKSTSGPLPTERDEFLLASGQPVQVFAQTGVLAPAGQAGGGAELLVNMERIAAVSADANHWSLRGQLGPAGTTDVLVVNGVTVVQEGSVIPGLPGPVASVIGRTYAGGHWAARGTDSTGLRYLVANGVLQALQGRPLPGLESLGNVARFDSIAMNARGDLAYQVQLADPFAGIGINYIVLQRPGEPLRIVVGPETQLDVGGSPLGAIFYDTPLSTDLGLGLSERLLYFTSRTQDGEGRSAGDGLFVLSLP